VKYRVIDIFAGPGGLGEGFSLYDSGRKFEIAVSAEMDEYAHKTLLLRSYYRHAKNENDTEALSSYYNYCNGDGPISPVDLNSRVSLEARNEALRATLGTPSGNQIIDEAIKKARLIDDNTILIGGPPCQAYSVVGRVRNRGNEDYKPEKDIRHFLYREYLRIIEKTRPIAFVMENVKGLLSANVGGVDIFSKILRDLSAPGRALGKDPNIQYTIHPLSIPSRFTNDTDFETIDPQSFIVRAENYGIPQTRHRVVLLGVRADKKYDGRYVLRSKQEMTFNDAVKDLPRLRSKLSRLDSPDQWALAIKTGVNALIRSAEKRDEYDLAIELKNALGSLDASLEFGDTRVKRDRRKKPGGLINGWFLDERLDVFLNHQARMHMPSDLTRYFYAAVFAKKYRRTPIGVKDFLLDGLSPNHANWTSGIFEDRFRVQLPDQPSTTVISHLSKDGHYFIHPDPAQCRSITVREAARLQTFPDNYFFQGNKTEQYHQVGNAVPPYLAYQIAELVAKVLDS
jgi:DNA (cytosine-5)-methyltransferase 1